MTETLQLILTLAGVALGACLGVLAASIQWFPSRWSGPSLPPEPPARTLAAWQEVERQQARDLGLDAEAMARLDAAHAAERAAVEEAFPVSSFSPKMRT